MSSSYNENMLEGYKPWCYVKSEERGGKSFKVTKGLLMIHEKKITVKERIYKMDKVSLWKITIQGSFEDTRVNSTESAWPKKYVCQLWAIYHVMIRRYWRNNNFKGIWKNKPTSHVDWLVHVQRKRVASSLSFSPGAKASGKMLQVLDNQVVHSIDMH